MVARLREAGVVGVRSFCADARARTDEVVGLAFAVGGGEAYYLPLAHRYLACQASSLVHAWRRRCGRCSRTQRGRSSGTISRPTTWPSSSWGSPAGALLRRGAGEPPAQRLAARAPAGRPGARADRLRAARRRAAVGRQAARRNDVRVEEGAAFTASSADAAHQLAARLLPELEEQKLLPLFRDSSCRSCRSSPRWEIKGVKVDRAALARIDQEVTRLLSDQEQKVYSLAGASFNINSKPAARQVLFEDLKLPVLRKGKTARRRTRRCWRSSPPSTRCRAEILEYRSLFKLKGTYLDALPTLIEKDGRIHTSFHQATTATGRLSSSDPNLQNIPVRTDLGKRVREAFIAEEGCLLVSADYSQIELRVLAHVSEDPALLESFGQGRGRAHPHRRRGLWRPHRPGDAVDCAAPPRPSTSASPTACRPTGSASGWDLPQQGSAGDHRPLLRALQGRARLLEPHHRHRQADRRGGHALRAPALRRRDPTAATRPRAWRRAHRRQPLPSRAPPPT